MALTRLTGQVNGGKLEAEGSLTLSREGIEDLSLKATGRNVFLDYPRGLRTVSNLDIRVRSEGSGFIVEGTADLLEGEYREVINARTFQQKAYGGGETSSLLDRMRFDLKIKTTAPFSVDNNLARVDAYAELRLAGTAARPALLGRLELDEGGRLYISERVFSIVRAVINFNSEKAIEPLLDLSAQTRIGDTW